MRRFSAVLMLLITAFTLSGCFIDEPGRGRYREREHERDREREHFCREHPYRCR